MDRPEEIVVAEASTHKKLVTSRALFLRAQGLHLMTKIWGKSGPKADLHAADFESQDCLGGGVIFPLAALYVPGVGPCIPGAQADLDVHNAGVPVVPGHVLQLYQLPLTQAQDPVCRRLGSSGKVWRSHQAGRHSGLP